MKKTLIALWAFAYLLAPAGHVAAEWEGCYQQQEPVETARGGSCGFPSVSISINAGAAVTDTRAVFVDIEFNDGIEVKLSEDPDLTGAEFMPIAARVPFTLSPGAMGKTVYAVVRGGCAYSPVVSDTIVYRPARIAPPAEPVPDTEEDGTGGDDFAEIPGTYPDGTLLRGITSGRIYVIRGEQKRYIASLAELYGRYAGVEIIDVHDWLLDTYPEFWE